MVEMVEFNMDYRRIQFLFCDDKDDHNIRAEFYRISGHDVKKATENPIVFYHKTDDWLSVPFAVTGAAHYEVGDRYYTHRSGMDTYQLIYTCSGHGVVRIGDKKFDCVKDTLLLVDCRQEHTYQVMQGERWEYKHIHFSAASNAGAVADKVAGQLVADLYDAFGYVDDVMLELHDVNANSIYVMSDRISRILTKLIQAETALSISHPRREAIERSVTYIRSHYMDKININELAQREFLSPYYFIRLFKEYYGMPPYDYLINYRLNQSKILLLKKKPIKDIALECGFGNANNFARSFKRHFGISPNAYCGRQNEPEELFALPVDFAEYSEQSGGMVKDENCSQ